MTAFGVFAGQPTHVYHVGDRLGVGVTQVMGEAGLREPLRGPKGAIRVKGMVGHLVHALIADWHGEPSPTLGFVDRVKLVGEARGVAYPPDIVDRAGPYWNSFVRLPGMLPLEARLWEHEVVVSEEPLICGTVDFWGRLGRRWVLLDWKCRAIAPSDTYQTIAYLMGLRRVTDLPPTARACVELRANADPRVRWQTDDASALASWQMAVRRWSQERVMAELTRGGKLKSKKKEEQGGGDQWLTEGDGDESGPEQPGSEGEGAGGDVAGDTDGG